MATYYSFYYYCLKQLLQADESQWPSWLFAEHRTIAPQIAPHGVVSPILTEGLGVAFFAVI